jgi:4-hydroxy-tetrahydrodipicolinate reductase
MAIETHSPGPAPRALPLAIIGMGRMGRAVDALALERGWDVRARFGRGDAINSDALRGATVAIEVSTAAGAPDNIRACVAAGCAVVSGTTGWDADLPAVQASVLRDGGALLWASNFSIGAHVLAAVGAYLAHALSDPAAQDVGYDAVLVETHHAGKRDAPSGTARAVAGAVGVAWGHPIPITSVRVGHVPGDHELIFDGPFDQLRLIHSVRDRRVFADGALIAASWLSGRLGIFSMDDVLGARAGDALDGATA